MSRTWICCAFPLLIGAAPPMDDATRQDLRCFTALLASVNEEDEAQKIAITVVAQYYYGRIDARAPGLDLEEAMAGELQSMTQADVAGHLVRCGTHVEGRGRYLIDVGEGLQKRGVQAAPTTT